MTLYPTRNRASYDRSIGGYVTVLMAFLGRFGHTLIFGKS